MFATSKLGILIVDDSMTYRMILREVLRNTEGVELRATARDGLDALEKLASLDVDLVFLDVEMPKMNGFETLHAIRQQYPDLPVVMISGVSRRSADITIQALEAGALDFIQKPDTGDTHGNINALREKLQPIINVCLQDRPKRRPDMGSSHQTVEGKEASTAPAAPVDLIVIGVSTGGPQALMQLIPKLPNDLDIPILIVQHMPPLFTASLAESLNRASTLSVREASDGDILEPNTVFIAPGGSHMVLDVTGTSPLNRQYSLKLDDGPPENSCKPAVDTLFRSVANSFRGKILALILTGMGQDGKLGVSLLKQRGDCYCITQTKSSCVIYGMPRAVEESGLSDEQLELEAIPQRIKVLTTGKRRFANP